MVGRHPFEKLRERMSPGARAAADAAAHRLDGEIDLAELRRALQLSQDEISHALQIAPGSVAEIEERADMYLSTVRRVIEEMGGELEIIATFGGQSVTIDTFAALHAKNGAR